MFLLAEISITLIGNYHTSCCKTTETTDGNIFRIGSVLGSLSSLLLLTFISYPGYTYWTCAIRNFAQVGGDIMSYFYTSGAKLKCFVSDLFKEKKNLSGIGLFLSFSTLCCKKMRFYCLFVLFFFFLGFTYLFGRQRERWVCFHPLVCFPNGLKAGPGPAARDIPAGLLHSCSAPLCCFKNKTNHESISRV